MRKRLVFLSPVIFVWSGVLLAEQVGVSPKIGRHLLTQPDRQMDLSTQLDFSVGRSFFRNPWVIAPATTTARDGLGPLYNASSCRSCHRGEGRGTSPKLGVALRDLLLRIGRSSLDLDVPPSAAFSANGFHPVYGSQLQTFAVAGVAAEGQVNVSYETSELVLSDGHRVELQRPSFQITNLGYSPLRLGVATSTFAISPRLTPALSGLGLLASIPKAEILKQQDPQDIDGDNISGRVNWVADSHSENLLLGRFGWKAGQPSIQQQVAAALLQDLGITSNIFSDENCTPAQRLCRQANTGGRPEINDKLLDYLSLYTANLAVPARRNIATKSVINGQRHFREADCHKCHREQWQTGRSASWPWLSNRTINPYTDMLLHDMGEALADGVTEFSASGREWRTPPLWGLGLADVVAEQPGFLHDGRARSPLEAILWHGGEAQVSRDKVVRLGKLEREELLLFLDSL